MFGVGFLFTLVRLWGSNYPKGLQDARSGEHDILDNFIHLILALLLSTQAVIDERIVDLYEHHMQQYLEGFRILYPTHSITPYHHLSLHFPRFMRLLGPWDSWGAGPYETYNGMSQKIPTNQTFGECFLSPQHQSLTSVIGDLEVTIMNTFSAASHLKGEVLPNLPSDLAEMRGIVQEHLSSSAFGGLARDTTAGHFNNQQWLPIPADPSDNGSHFPADLFQILKKGVSGTPPSRRLIPCHSMTKSGMVFSTGSKSARDSQICYRRPSGDFEFGRINSILVEGGDQIQPALRSPGRIFLLVEQYEPLHAEDATKDPFRSHPLVGDKGYNLVRILYDNFIDQISVIEAADVVGHIARCSLDEGVPFRYAKPAFVAAQLDRVSYRVRGFDLH